MDRAAKTQTRDGITSVETATEETGDGRRRVASHHVWSKVAETTAPLEVIENRYPALFETRRILYPRLAEFADPKRYDQGIGGFLDNIQLARFAEFGEFATKVTGAPSTKNERVDSQGVRTPITGELLSGVDTFVVISLDVVRTGQQASEDEIAALRDFLDVADNLLVVAPHHSIGDYPEKEFLHHGDRTTPPEQRFSGFARSILAGLDVPVDNRLGSAGRSCMMEIPPRSNATPTSTGWACSKASLRSTHIRTCRTSSAVEPRLRNLTSWPASASTRMLRPTHSRRTEGRRSTRCSNPDPEFSRATFWWATRRLPIHLGRA